MVAAVVGKGGVGKTTVTALLLRRLLDARQTPVLLIDGDPSNCLGPAVGLPVAQTLADLREGVRDDPARPASMSKTDWFAIRAEETVVEHEGFDLLTMGRPEGPGCYCFVNSVIRGHLDRMARSYRHVLIDCEAGLEHLSRRTTGQPDRLVCVTNRARMGAETVRRALETYRSLHESLPVLDLVLNGFDPGDAQIAETMERAAAPGADFARVFTLPWSDELVAFDTAGRTLLELGQDAPALAALHAWEDCA